MMIPHLPLTDAYTTSLTALHTRVKDETSMTVAPATLLRLNWRIVLALGLTALWLSYWLYYLNASVGWNAFLNKPIESLGAFLEGAFAPLAFLWLVVGYFLQQHELSKNTDAIRQQHIEMGKSLEYAAVQSESLEASSCYTQQQTFVQIYGLVRETMGGIVGMLFISSQGLSGNGRVDSDTSAELWAQMAQGDPEKFSRRMLQLNAEGEQDFGELLYGSDIRTRHCENFMRQFNRLLERARRCDSSGMLEEVVHSSAHGLLYNLMVECQGQRQA